MPQPTGLLAATIWILPWKFILEIVPTRVQIAKYWRWTRKPRRSIACSTAVVGPQGTGAPPAEAVPMDSNDQRE